MARKLDLGRHERKRRSFSFVMARPGLGTTERGATGMLYLGSARAFWHHARMGHPRPPRRLSPADLKGAALDYLDRFAATRARLRQVMLRKIRHSARVHEDDPAPLLAALDETIQWLEARGFLSDRAYAEAKARALNARGTSRARIIARLAARGVEAETARAAIDRLSTECEEPELEAARRYAKRRRLGPYRGAAASRAECRDKDLAAMARAGFAGRVARQVIDAKREA
jgi:regulatory protein